MEYLVTMTTRVPEGVTPEAVDETRAREAIRSRELAANGHLLRLWRPPLQPGEWRTLGLFSAGDEDELEQVLASMPLRVWRSDQVTPLATHPNDPGAGREPSGTPGREFLTVLTVDVPAGTPAATVEDTKAAEAARAAELARLGQLLRLWTPPNEPGQWRILGLWRADDDAALAATLTSLPLRPWMTIDTTPLSEHPNDPAAR